MDRYFRCSDGRPRPSAMHVLFVRHAETVRISATIAALPERLQGNFCDVLYISTLDSAEPARTICVDVCFRGNGRRFDLHGLVIMPDHVHLVLTPSSDDAGFISLMQIMQSIKGAAAHRINAALRRKGRVWQEESFDRVLRKEEYVGAKVEYVLENPVRAGLVKIASDYLWSWTSGKMTEGRAGTPASTSSLKQNEGR